MLQERITTALHLPNFAARADSERDASTPEGQDCTCYFERDWTDESDDAVRGGRWTRVCNSSMIGVFAHNEDGTITAFTRDEAYSAFGVPWVRQIEIFDAEEAENE